MTDNKQRVTVHLPQELWEALVQRADAAEQMVAEYAEELLKRAVAEMGDSDGGLL